MKRKIIDLVLNAKYEEAYNHMKSMSIDEKWSLVGDDMYNEDPLRVYTFLLYLVSRDSNESDWQYNCFVYLVFYNPFFDDTMSLAAWHIRKALELDSCNLEYKKQVILIFFSYPKQYFSDKEFLEYAKDVLVQEPENIDANKIISMSHGKVGKTPITNSVKSKNGDIEH